MESDEEEVELLATECEPVEHVGISHDGLRHALAHLTVMDLFNCECVCREWYALLRETGDTCWFSAIKTTWPSTSGFDATAIGTDPRDLAIRMLGRGRHQRRVEQHLQLAITITTSSSTTDLTTMLPRHWPNPTVVDVAQTFEYAASQAARYASSDLGSGLEFDVHLPLPSRYPIEAAPDGHAVMLDYACLVDAMWLEADRAASAGCIAVPPPGTPPPESPDLEVGGVRR